MSFDVVVAGRIAGKLQRLGGKIDGNVSDASQTVQCSLDLADATCAIHALDAKARALTAAGAEKLSFDLLSPRGGRVRRLRHHEKVNTD